MDLLILVPKVTNRINYIFELIFGNLLGLDFKITSNKDSFDSFDGAKLHYGDKPFGDELFQKSTSILFEHFVIFQKLVVVDYNDIKTIFPVHHKNSIFPFDLLLPRFILLLDTKSICLMCRTNITDFKLRILSCIRQDY